MLEYSRLLNMSIWLIQHSWTPDQTLFDLGPYRPRPPSQAQTLRAGIG